jgi:hypothetical protein
MTFRVGVHTARRETTKEEDIANCMIGIFDITMPLLYGEEPKAFCRLQEEVMESSINRSLLAWTVPGQKVHSRLPTLLANHPRQFAHSAHILPLCEQLCPFTMTNKGLCIHLPALKRFGNLERGWSGTGILSCAEERNLTGPLRFTVR